MKKESKTLLDGLKEKLDKKSIKDIEGSIDENKQLVWEHSKEEIIYLFYLKRTSRFKENPMYKNSTFDTYINDRFCIREKTFNERLMAFVSFPEEAAKYGPKVISSIKKKCGINKLKTVLEEIKKEDSKTKDIINRDKITKIISKYELPKKIKSDYVIDWQLKYQAEQKLRTEIENENKELKEQVRKLKNRVNELERLNQQFNDILPDLSAITEKAKGLSLTTH